VLLSHIYICTQIYIYIYIHIYIYIYIYTHSTVANITYCCPSACCRKFLYAPSSVWRAALLPLLSRYLPMVPIRRAADSRGTFMSLFMMSSGREG
jgi:hypothetical protein